jgi:hypothetical protein|tara:strand:+ start:2284 stop:2439 length:156 start_codon:yes stop_codon:yes gene_type:complete
MDEYEVDNIKRALAQRCLDVIGDVQGCINANPEDVEDLLLDVIEHLQEESL